MGSFGRHGLANSTQENSLSSYNLNRYFGVLAAFIGLVSLAPLTGAHADPPATAATFASVDIDQAIQNSKLSNNINDGLATYQKREIANFALVTDGSAVFLSDAEVGELDTLYEKEKPTDVDKKRIPELVAIADTRRGQLTTLENNAKPTEEQRKQFNDLTAMRDHGAGRKQEFYQIFQNRLQEKKRELTVQAIKDARSAVADVAKAKAITVVFDSNTAIYTSNDITPDVIKQLNK